MNYVCCNLFLSVLVTTFSGSPCSVDCCQNRVLFDMSSRQDSDVDDDFSDLYKEYTGPVRSNTTKAQEITVTNKRSHAGSDEEEDAPDPNAVPTDFTSREAKVWEAKSKATERNWKKRKEEELICKICGESGHFTQVLLCIRVLISVLVTTILVG